MRLIDPKSKSNLLYVSSLAFEQMQRIPTIEAEPVKHGRWKLKYDEHDDCVHHFCTACGTYAIFSYDEQDTYDEGFDGEWKYMGKTVIGITEHITDYCPNCGSKNLEGNA